MALARAEGAPAAAGNRVETPSGRAGENVRGLHRVNRGETLTGIAQQYGVSVGALKIANKMNDNNVRVGSVMVIPAS